MLYMHAHSHFYIWNKISSSKYQFILCLFIKKIEDFALDIYFVLFITFVPVWLIIFYVLCIIGVCLVSPENSTAKGKDVNREQCCNVTVCSATVWKWTESPHGHGALLGCWKGLPCTGIWRVCLELSCHGFRGNQSKVRSRSTFMSHSTDCKRSCLVCRIVRRSACWGFT